MKLIDKDALVAEINRGMYVFSGQKSQREATQIDRLSLGARIAMLEELKVFINTLETKEVGLEKEKSSDEVLKIRQEVYQSGYNDGYKHGCEDTKKKGE